MPLLFIPPEKKILFRDYFGIEPSFPRDQYILRCEESAKNRTLYYCSKSVKAVLESKDLERLHIVNTGVRLFVRQGSLEDDKEDAPFRLTADGLPLLERVLVDDRRKVAISDEQDLKTLLVEIMPIIDTLSLDTQEKLKRLGKKKYN